MVPLQRLEKIRHLKIYYGPNTSIPHTHPRTEKYDLPRNYRSHGDKCHDARQATYEIQRFRPLLRLRELSRFQLQLSYIGSHDAVVRYES